MIKDLAPALLVSAAGILIMVYALDQGRSPSDDARNRPLKSKANAGITPQASLARRVSARSSLFVARGFQNVWGLIKQRCELNTPLRQAHFLAQIAHETAGFRYMTEAVTKLCTKYDGGCLYRGRGYLHLTHRRNYEKYGRKIKVDLRRRPELAAKPVYAAAVACEYWRENGLNKHADRNDIDAISRAINGQGATNKSLINRRIFFKRARRALNIMGETS